MAPSNLRPIDQLLETIRYLHDNAVSVQIEVSFQDTKRPPNGRVYTLTLPAGVEPLNEGSYIPGQGSMSSEGGTVERTADPLAISLQIRDAIHKQRVWHEVRAAKAQELLDRDAAQQFAQTTPYGAQETAEAMGKTSDEFARDCAEAMRMSCPSCGR